MDAEILRVGDTFELGKLKWKITRRNFHVVSTGRKRYKELRKKITDADLYCPFCLERGRMSKRTISAVILEKVLEQPIPCCPCANSVYGTCWRIQKQDPKAYSDIYQRLLKLEGKI